MANRIDSRAAGLVHVREYDVLDTQDGIFCDDLVDIVDHLVERNMVGERDKTELGAPALDFGNGMSVILTIELDTCITHLADLLEGSEHVGLHIGTDAVKLDSHRKLLGELY